MTPEDRNAFLALKIDRASARAELQTLRQAYEDLLVRFQAERQRADAAEEDAEVYYRAYQHLKQETES